MSLVLKEGWCLAGGRLRVEAPMGLCDGGCFDGPTNALITNVYVNGSLIFWGITWFWGACCVLRKDYGDTKEAILVYCVLPFVLAPACAAIWPVLCLWWLVCRAPRNVVNGIVYVRGREPARRRQAAIRYLSQFSPESKRRWSNRGWLVMLQVRHKAHLEQQQGSQKSRAWRCRRETKHSRGIPRAKLNGPLAVAGDEPSAGTQGVADMGQCEEGNSNQEFAPAVVSVVDIMEDGIFRKIVLYL